MAEQTRHDKQEIQRCFRTLKFRLEDGRLETWRTAARIQMWSLGLCRIGQHPVVAVGYDGNLEDRLGTALVGRNQSYCGMKTDPGTVHGRPA